MLHDAPHNTPISRPDEVKAAKTPVLSWKPASNADLSAACLTGSEHSLSDKCRTTLLDRQALHERR